MRYYWTRSICRVKGWITEIVCYNESATLGKRLLWPLTDGAYATSSSNLRASLSGKDIPEDIKERLLKMHEENITLQEQCKTAQEKLVKARAVRPYFYRYVESD